MIQVVTTSKLEQIRENIAKQIKARREYLQISYSELSEATGITARVLERFEEGKFWFGTKHLVVICLALGMESIDLG